ncbi:chemotaxis protein CheX [Cognatilysobacter bugurensis]|uniref:Chemotaxis protein CheX n=1 Tax=Cognatilysobacter bugurensis TaxID=543356 RepID=A0A918W405_9GAMM|nr:chemotaxis protein CheX [Lysobacter bugurensis]GHA70304.1 chemotaxis protein CheX [Lysobacter bugurensis]
MAAKFFGQFLLEQGLIDGAQLLEALEVQRASNPLLGELAQARGWLTAAQAARINERQRAEDKRFGDIAEEMGLLDGHQLSQLLDEQKARRKLFGEILVDRNMLTREQVESALKAQQNDRDDALKSLELGMAGHPLADIASAALATCGRLFPRLLKQQAQFSRLVDAGEAAPPTGVVASVHIAAQRSFTLALGCDAATATGIACGFLGITADECDDALAQDALGELVNVLMGYVVKDVLPDDMAYRPSPPSFSDNVEPLLDGAPSLALVLTSQLGPAVLVVRG